MTTAEQVKAFREKQSKIMELHKAYEEAVNKVGADCESRIEAIKTEYEVKKAELGQELERAKSEYKAAVKAAFGVTDGETINVIDMVEFISRVTGQA